MKLSKKEMAYLLWLGLMIIGFGAGWTMASAGCI